MRAYMRALSSSKVALSLSMSCACMGQLMPRPSASLGLGICARVSCGPWRGAAARRTHHVEVDVVDQLVRGAPVVLQHVEVGGALRARHALRHRQHLAQRLVRHVRQLGAVVLRDDQLPPVSAGPGRQGSGARRPRTAWPVASGWMSRKASTEALSYSLKAGSSPVPGQPCSARRHVRRRVDIPLTILQKMHEARDDILLLVAMPAGI